MKFSTIILLALVFLVGLYSYTAIQNCKQLNRRVYELEDRFSYTPHFTNDSGAYCPPTHASWLFNWAHSTQPNGQVLQEDLGFRADGLVVWRFSTNQTKERREY